MNWLDFESAVYEAARKSFSEVQEAHGDEVFYVFAMYIDSSAMSVACSSNSLQFLERKLAQEDYLDATYEDVAYLKWASSEWGYEAFGLGYFKAVNEELRTSPLRRDFDAFRGGVLRVLTNVLLKLKGEGVFKACESFGESILFVTITDDDCAEDVENESAGVLNERDALSRFIARYE